jgi:hypothetical protein
MATVLRFPIEKVVPIRGLTKHECEAVDAGAHDMMLRGWVTGVSTLNGGQYMCVFDRCGQPYFIGREEGVCYLFDPHEAQLAESRRFHEVLESLSTILSVAR